jgi:hypothetical protein
MLKVVAADMDKIELACDLVVKRNFYPGKHNVCLILE